MLSSFIENASTYGVDIDRLFLLITILVGFWFIIAEAALFYFVIFYRRKKGVKAQYITGETKRQKRWITIPHNLIILCDIVIIVAAIMVWYKVKQSLPEPDEKIRIIAQQWAWTFVHAGPDQILDTSDDITTTESLHIKVNTTYHFELESTDVVHSFSVPAFRLKQDSIPGRVITGWFNANKTGIYDIQCAEICGLGHGVMFGKVFVESSDNHKKWITQNLNENRGAVVADVNKDKPIKISNNNG